MPGKWHFKGMPGIFGGHDRNGGRGTALRFTDIRRGVAKWQKANHAEAWLAYPRPSRTATANTRFSRRLQEAGIGHRTKRFFQWSGKMGERLWKPNGLGMIGEMGWIFRSGFFLYMDLHLLYVWEAFLRIIGRLLYIGLADGVKTPGRALFSAVWPFCGWVGRFGYMMVGTAVWPFFCVYF